MTTARLRSIRGRALEAQDAGNVPPDFLATSGVLDLKELRNAGYLQEVNRLFFHPLGLALAIQPDNRLCVLDRRADLEGFVFSDPSSLTEKADLIEAERQRRRIPRMLKLGYFVQPPMKLNIESETVKHRKGKRAF
jgi:hypothetical protein